MGTPITKTISAWSSGISDEWDLEHFIRILQDAMAKIPSNERATAKFSIDHTSGGYDESCELNVCVNYIHTETPEEVEAREAKARQERVNFAAERIAREAATLRHLMDKYGIDAKIDVMKAIKEINGETL